MGSRLEKNSESVRKRIEGHTFEDEEGEEYEGSKFGGFADYFRRKKLKLQNLDAQVRSEAVGKQSIFRGVVAHVNGYTQPSLNDLHHLIVSHGGGFLQYLDGKTTVTHIIAANLTPKKAIEFRRYRIVKPAWVVDSIASGKLLPWSSYRVLDEGSGQNVLGFDEGKVVSQANNRQRGYRDQTNTSWYASQVKKVAEHIDDEAGALFPSSQVQRMNGLGDFTTDLADRKTRVPSEALPQTAKSDADTSSSGSFELTSSLENALDNATTTSGPAEQVTPRPPCLPLTSADSTKKTPDDAAEFGNDEDLEDSLEVATPTKLQSSPNERKRSHDDETLSSAKKAKLITAEEHNALLLADPRMRKTSTANPDFIKQYYAESRLHHLSTWKADLKSRFQQMAEEKTASQKVTKKRKPGARRYIMHVDFDSFFCAVSLKRAPEFVDKPAVVAHGSGNGSEIASCNYPARAFGVKNGMWMKKALELCSHIKVLPYDFPAYEDASKGFYEAILDVGGIVQSVSVDEALLDITSLCLPAGGTDDVGIQEGSIGREQEKADGIGNALRAKIKEKIGCNVSVGIGGSILLAKVALRKAKPAGQHQIKPEEVLDFIGELSVQDLPGVAYSIGGKLEEIGVKFVKDVRQLTKDRLMTVLGPKTGERIWDYSRGIDRTEVGEQAVRKSVSAEVNWGIRFISQSEAEEFVQNLCIELQRRLVDQRVKGRQLTMKIMRKAADAPLDPPKNLGHGKCDTFNKSIVLGVATNNAEIIGREAISILRSYGFSPGELRGLGAQMTKLEPLKVSTTLPDGSQRRITFGVSAAPKLNKQITEDPIDDPQTPQKPKTTADAFDRRPEEPIELTTSTKAKTPAGRFIGNHDPIDMIESPEKAKATAVHPAAAISRANAADQSAKKFLNITGTQFIMPTQVDPSVLAELPSDIRSKLLAQSKPKTTSGSGSASIANSRSQSPALQNDMPPLPSQLDPEVFSALPEDMKAEILASYNHSHAGQSRGAQGILPQSPRKIRFIDLPTKKITPTKPRRGRPPVAKGRPKTDPTRSSFMTKRPITGGGFEGLKEQAADGEGGYSSDTLDPDFLSALPDDVRAEVVNEHRRKRLAKTFGLTTVPPNRKRKAPDSLPAGQRKLFLPERAPKPTFTTQELSAVPELRETLNTWFEEFKDDGPHPEDVGAMERYLKRVVLDERDLGKVVSVVRWLAWLVDEADGDNEGTKAWSLALVGIRENVQEAVRERGLGRLEL